MLVVFFCCQYLIFLCMITQADNTKLRLCLSCITVPCNTCTQPGHPWLHPQCCCKASAYSNRLCNHALWRCSGPLLPSPRVYSAASIFSLQRWRETFFFPILIPIDVRPSPCVTQVRHGSMRKISPPYIAQFWRRLWTQANSTLDYLVDFTFLLLSVHYPYSW